MRELKFRVWDKKTGKYLLPWPNSGFTLFGEVTCFDLIGQQFGKYENRLLRYNDLIIEQFTGKRDRNGDDIYEGDVIYLYDEEERKNVKREVYYDVQMVGYQLRYTREDLANPPMGSISIVGNIHEMKREEYELV
jgi:hypothetical protein